MPVSMEGHRARMRLRAESIGAEHMRPQELVEMMLYYALPRRDTREQAHALIGAFGSVEGVLAASEQELMKVLPRDHWNRINFQLIYLGREICTARKAKCTQCPLQEWCEKNL